MKVLVTGANGQLGYDVVKLLNNSKYAVFPFDRMQMDITNEGIVQQTVEDIKPDVIIHCAAYTNVDGAEKDEVTAYQVNALGTKNIAKAAESVDAKLVYVSTDYVFDGVANRPYEVDDLTNPLNNYGKTKLAGEKFVKEILDKYFIVRTAWVFGINGNNFVKTMLRLGKENGEVRVVSDQIGSPTYTVDLAEILVEMINTDKYGIYHVTNSGECSWYEFATEIFKQAGLDVKVHPITTDQYETLAKRPLYSVLSKNNLLKNGFTIPRNWRLALKDYLEKLEAI